ncbi:cytochrome c oxidase subunit II [Microvirga pudoricolor]|uniref:cytochrome c oxidase subunit II n=1 Tax=Microvirga pudoricolor TaxID=2778729 RepID=UPI001E341712|nr:cytochrome c oxidase subunit II [Microvirga pudoricolor]
MRIEASGYRSAAALFTAVIAFMLGFSEAFAAQPQPWEATMQPMVTEVGRDLSNFHTYLVWLVTIVCLFVLALLVIIVVRFNEKRNPTPSKTTHNTLLEVAWTIVPVLILVAIAIPSFRLLRLQLVVPNPDIVVKATGYAWYWGYEYPADQGGGFKFDSNMVDSKDLKPGQPKLLTVDNDMVVPVNKIVKVQVTAADVLHSFAMPSFGIKVDAVPGRLNETWFKADQVGTYHGQCSELCGNGHPYMPITIRVVSEQDYAAWLTESKAKFASNDSAAPVKLADAQ